MVPCFNEAQALPATCAALTKVVRDMRRDSIVDDQSLIVLVDDGSSDRTWEQVRSLSEAASGKPADVVRVAGIRLARNSGHQAAIIAGMQVASRFSDVVVTIDADLQDDPEAIPEMVRMCTAGFEVVLGVRRSREVDSAFKRMTAKGFYRLMRLMGVTIVEDHADFRAMSRVAVARLMEFPERNLFLRAVVPNLTNRLGMVRYDRAARVAGESKYPLRKMLSFAWRGITANSTVPLRIVFFLGLSSLAMSIIGVSYALWGYLRGETVPGWLSLVASQLFVGGVIMLSQAVFGEYLARIYIETKRRPHSFIAEDIGITESGPEADLAMDACAHGH